MPQECVHILWGGVFLDPQEFVHILWGGASDPQEFVHILGGRVGWAITLEGRPPQPLWGERAGGAAIRTGRTVTSESSQRCSRAQLLQDKYRPFVELKHGTCQARRSTLT